MEFSIETLKRKLKEIENNPFLGEFVRQQYEIQKLILLIIFYSIAKSNYKNLEWLNQNEKFLKNLSSLTLGQLIQIFPNLEDGKNIIEKLQEYNKRRKNLIHHQDQIILQITEPYKEIEKEKQYLEETLKLGEEIKTDLFEFLKIIFKNQ
jgi:ribosomal protein L3